MKTATEILREEHTLILRALDVLESAAGRLERGGGPGEDWWREVLGWLRAFADRNHHAKEERALFPAMIKAGVPGAPGGPIGVMLEEHVAGRALVATMESGAAARRAASARDYVALLRAHIDKENEVLFPLADSALEADGQRALAREFEALADELGRDAALAYAGAVLDGLAAALAPGAPPGASER